VHEKKKLVRVVSHSNVLEWQAFSTLAWRLATPRERRKKEWGLVEKFPNAVMPVPRGNVFPDKIQRRLDLARRKYPNALWRH
jgi:hypothetical protein